MSLTPWWVPLVFALPGAVSVARGLAGVAAVRAQRRWRQAEALIVSSDLEDGRLQEFDVEYRYDVAGQTYTNDQIVPGKDSARGADALELAHQYPRGRHTIVFYNPQDPTQSALELSGLEQILRPVLVGGGVVLLAGIWMWFLAV
jgi:hypothetical protein